MIARMRRKGDTNWASPFGLSIVAVSIVCTVLGAPAIGFGLILPFVVDEIL